MKGMFKLCSNLCDPADSVFLFETNSKMFLNDLVFSGLVVNAVRHTFFYQKETIQ